MSARTRTVLWVTLPLVAAALVPQFVEARVETITDWFTGVTALLFLKPIVVGLFLINSILNYLLRAAAAILNHVTSGDFLAVPITQYPIVQIGWRITRDLANMAFVLVLLYIAFGIILRLSQVNAKQILPKLIGAALLINFSLVLVGFAIDISNRVMLLFLDPITKGDMAGAILTGSKLIETYANAFVSIRLSAQIADIAGMIFTVIFTAILTGIFVVLALMFVARLIIFWQIAIMAPLAWLSAGIPIPGMNFFGDWLTRFKRWLFWGPKAAFWVFLAVMAARAFQNQNLAQSWAPFDLSKQSNLLATIPNALLNAATPILQYIVIVMFLVYAINAIREGTGQEFGKYLNVDTILGKLRKPYQAAWKATGVPGGVAQRWEQIKKEGIKFRGKQLYGGQKAREGREAYVAQYVGRKKRAFTKLRESRQREDLKGTRENVMDVLDETTLKTLSLGHAVTVTPPGSATPVTIKPEDENPAAAAQELISRRDYFEDIETNERVAYLRAHPGATRTDADRAAKAAAKQERDRLRKVVESFVKQPGPQTVGEHTKAYFKGG